MEHTYAVFAGGHGAFVAMIANESRSPLNLGTAAAGYRMLTDQDPTCILHQTGMLNAAHGLQLSSLRAVLQDPTNDELFYFLTLCLFVFFCGCLVFVLTRPCKDIVYVRDTGSCSLCSCNIFALHGQCEHSVFVDSIQVNARPPRLDLNRLPATRRSTKRKRTAVNPRKQRSAYSQKKRKPQDVKAWARCALLRTAT